MYTLGAPAAELLPFIDRYWFVTCPPDQTFRLAVDVYVDAQADLVINHGVPYERVSADGSVARVPWSSVDAQRRRPVVIRQEGRVRVCGARFRPGGLAAFTSRRMGELTDLVVPATAVLGNGVASLERDLAEADADSRSSTFDAFFLGRLREDAAYERFRAILARVDAALPGELRVGSIAGANGVSVRAVQRLFSRYLGLGPRFYHRVARFQRAMRAMMDDPACDLAEVAIAAGYYDQPHLVREFHELAGGVPRRYKGYLPETGRDFAPNVVRYDDALPGHPPTDDGSGDERDERVEAKIDQH